MRTVLNRTTYYNEFLPDSGSHVELFYQIYYTYVFDLGISL